MDMPTYDFYKSQYFGDKLNAAKFLTYSHRAVDYINYITFGRAKDSSLREVKKAICAVAEVIYDEDINGGIVQSLSVNGQSAIYDSKSVKNKKYNTAARYLFNTGLLYGGHKPLN